jgi:hypothetical protein
MTNLASPMQSTARRPAARRLAQRFPGLVAELKDWQKERLRRFDVCKHFGSLRFFPAIGATVDHSCAAHGLEPPS